MRLTRPPASERGSLTIVYACDACGYEMAMLTNPYETQVVQSLGVRIGPGAASGCPLAAALPSSDSPQPQGGESRSPNPQPLSRGERGDIVWTAAAEARLQGIPAFVRSMARTGIESFARERGLAEIDEQVMDQARQHFGM
jgi:hypothetical protein